jgi:alkylation response protein AidB-like acyl-CoA dehydrogenase
MIDKHEFFAGWKSLCRRFNREVDADEAREYWEYLSPQMETDAFRMASRKLWASREFFPRPDDFLTSVQPSSEAAALEQWELCERVMSGEVHVMERMTAAGQKTVRLMGGIDRLRNTPIDEVHFRRAEFLRLHGQADEIHRREAGLALPAWTDDDSERVRQIAPGLKLLKG